MADELKQFMDVVSEIRREVEVLGKDSAEAKAATVKASEDLVKAYKEIDELKNAANRPAAPDTKKAEWDAQYKAFGEAMRRKGDYQISGNTTGGYTVPALMASEIIRKQRDYDPVRALARVMSISNGSPLNIPRITTNQTGGFTTETSTRTASSAAVMEQRVLTPHPLYTQVKVTYALLEDSAFDIAALIMDEGAQALAYYEGEKFVLGDGNGVPYGVMNDSTVLANYETAGNDTLTADALVKLPFKVKSFYHAGAVYLMSPATMAAAVALKEESTSGGYYFHVEPTAPYKWTFNGYPCYLSDSMVDVGASNYPVVFGNFQKGYWIADVAGSMRIIIDPYTTKGYILYHIEKRVGGQVADPDAFAVIVTT